MAFQTTTREFQGSALPGDFALDSYHDYQRASIWNIHSWFSGGGNVFPNIVGYAYGYIPSTRTAISGNLTFINGGVIFYQFFAGILLGTKENAFYGTNSFGVQHPLIPSSQVSDTASVTLVRSGIIHVEFSDSGNLGDDVYYYGQGGKISGGSPSVGLVKIPGAKIIGGDVSPGDLGTILLTGYVGAIDVIQ